MRARHGGPLHTSNEREANNNQDMAGMLTRPAARQHDYVLIYRVRSLYSL